jgi:phage-related protein
VISQNIASRTALTTEFKNCGCRNRWLVPTSVKSLNRTAVNPRETWILTQAEAGNIVIDMPRSKCRFIKHVAEFVLKEQWDNVPDNTRGIYALLEQKADGHYDVVYVGMSSGKKAGIYARLKNHRARKDIDWTHFSVFEVHDNITDQEIRELEGLFRHMYRKDTQANKYNKQLRHQPFEKIAVPGKSLKKPYWGEKESQY